MFVHLSQLLSGLKPILSLSASQLSCISAMAMGPQRNAANMPSSVPFGMRWRMIGPWPVIKHEPQQSPSVEELFGPGVDPEEEVLYPRYCDASGEVVDNFPTNPNGSMLNIESITNLGSFLFCITISNFFYLTLTSR